MADPRSELLAWLDTNAGRPRDAMLGELVTLVVRMELPLVDAWWHAGDFEAAFEWSARRLTELGIEPITKDAFAMWHQRLEDIQDEEEQRRHQIGFVATYANARLSGARSFYCAGPALSWESDEPAWLLLDEREHERLDALAGPPPALEAAYSGKAKPPMELAASSEDLSLLSPLRAAQKAEAAFQAGRFAEALRYQERVSEEGEFGALARLRRIDLIRKIGQTDEARSLWSTTADEWLSGRRKVWDTQWKTLLEHHRKLRLSSDDPRLPQIQTLAGRPPVRRDAPPGACRRCNGTGWISKGPSSFPAPCGCKR